MKLMLKIRGGILIAGFIGFGIKVSFAYFTLQSVKKVWSPHACSKKRSGLHEGIRTSKDK